MKKRVVLFSFLAVGLLLVATIAQDAGSGRGALRERLLERFDKDGDGRLSAEERKELRAAVQKFREGGSGRMEEPKPTHLRDLYGAKEPAVSLVQKDLELKDTERDKILQFRATYPEKTSGVLPVIVWSHGMYGSQDSYQPLVKHWARHGYLVLQPTHSDSLRRGEGLANPTSDWESRPEDVTFLLDSVKSHPLLGKLADMNRVGMGGHSYGAHTTMLVEGADPRIGGDFSDPRPKAFIAISPQGESLLLTDSSWSGMTRPTLFISGDNDTSMEHQPASWRLTPFKKSPAGEKYLLWVKDAYHNFGGISGARFPGSGPANGDQVALVKSATLAFWDKYLKHDPEATRLIDSGDFAEASQGLATWTER